MPARHPPFFASAVASLVAMLGMPALATGLPDTEALRGAIDQAVRDGFTGAVLVVHAGQTVLVEGRGTAQPANGVSVTPETVFDIGSVSKEFTRALTLDLVAHGTLRLDQPLSELLPDVPADKAAITVGQVLDHRAGLAEYVDRDGEEGDFTPLTREQALERILGDPLRFAPGTEEGYSNAGYTLLAILVERATGKPFQQVLRERILDPAGMTSTGFYRHGWKPERVAHGQGPAHFTDVNSPASWPEPAWALLGNGGMVSTAGDLARWHRAVVEGTVLSAAARDALLERMRPQETSMVAGANDFGFCTFIARLPDDTQVYVLGSSGIERTRDLAQALVRAAGSELPLPPPRADGPPEQDGSEREPPDFPDSPTGRRLRDIYRALDPATDLASFLEATFTPELFASHSLDEHRSLWNEVRRLLGARPEVATLRTTGPSSAEMVLRSPAGDAISFAVEVEPREPHRIASVLVQ